MADIRDQIADHLRQLMELTVLDEGAQSFRARAYENAMHEIRGLTEDPSNMTESQLVKQPGIGKSTAKKIREFIDTGRIAKLEGLREKFPPEYVAMSKIPGLGPKSLKRLRDELGVENVDQLKAAIAANKLRELPGFGQKSEEKISKAIERLGLTGKDMRTPIARAMPIAARLVGQLEALDGAERAQYCGSLRRQRETIADIDIVVTGDQPAALAKHFAELRQVKEIIGSGETKTSVITDEGMQVDVRAVKPDQFGAATLYFTGSKAHNIKLRQLAMDKGWLLNEYGLIDNDSGEVIASRTEEDIYKALGLPWIPGPMREDLGEVEAAAAGELPEWITLDDMTGDLHVHSDWSGDGRSTLDDMIATAAGKGYTFLAITDHGEDLTINGVSRERLIEQKEHFKRLQQVHPQMQLMHGCELNIGPDGGLDYDEKFRLSLDWCVAAVHSHWDLPVAQQTERIIVAMNDPAVNVIGHLTGRMIGKRPGIELDMGAIFDAAVETKTAIELNSALPRLDVAADVLRRGREKGVTFVISTDAHQVGELDRMRWGTRQSQRGWLAKSQVANTWDQATFMAWRKAQREHKERR